MARRKKIRTAARGRKKKPAGKKAPAKKKKASRKRKAAGKKRPAKKKARAKKKKTAKKKAPARKKKPPKKKKAAAPAKKPKPIAIAPPAKTVTLKKKPAPTPHATIEETARRRFRAEKPTRKPLATSKLNAGTLWDALIFAIVSKAGPRGITIENICKKAIEVKHSRAEIKEKNISPASNFHNSSISNIEAVRRYLDDDIYQAIYGIREITKKSKK